MSHNYGLGGTFGNAIRLHADVPGPLWNGTRRVEAPFPMDMLVWRPTEAEKGDAFTRSVLSEGKVMYESGFLLNA